MFWRSDLETHVDQHNGPTGSAIILPVCVGTRSADFEQTLLVPPHDSLSLRGMTLACSLDVGASATDYWTLTLIQLDAQQRTFEIFEHDGSTKSISAGEPLFLPLSQSASVPLEDRRPVVLRGVKVGSPAALNDLFVQLLGRLA